MGRPSRPRFGRRGHTKTGNSGAGGGTTPKAPAVTLAAPVVVVATGVVLTVPGVEEAKEK